MMKHDSGDYKKDGGVHLVKNKKGEVVSIIDRSQKGTNFAVHSFEGEQREESENISIDFSDSAIYDDPTKSGAKAYADAVFNTLSEVAGKAQLNDVVQTAERLKFTVDSARDHFKVMKFKNQEHLNYTFSGIMKNIGKQFDVTKPGGVKYGYKTVYDGNSKVRTHNKWGRPIKIDKLDCSSLVSMGVGILGFNDLKSPNLNILDNRDTYKYMSKYKNVKKPKIGKDLYTALEYNADGELYQTTSYGKVVKDEVANGVVNQLRNGSVYDMYTFNK